DPEIIDDIKVHLREVEPQTQARLNSVIESHANRHVQVLLEPIGHFLTPIFFVLTGMDVKLDTLFNGPILLLALGIALAAFAGKIVSGLVAGPVRKAIVGFGMIPRGEVDLIFAATGKAIGVIDDDVFSAIVIVVILSALLTPPILTFLLKRN